MFGSESSGPGPTTYHPIPMEQSGYKSLRPRLAPMPKVSDRHETHRKDENVHSSTVPPVPGPGAYATLDTLGTRPVFNLHVSER